MDRSVTGADLPRGQFLFSFGLVSSLFFVWGLSYGLLDSLNKTFQDSLNLTKAQSTGLQACYFGAYLINGPISGPLARKFGYKFAIHGGLGLFSLGAVMFWPCAVTFSYPGFLVCTFITASGLAWLEVAANSYITVLGSPDMAAFRLVFAQSWNGVASVIGPIIASHTFLKTGKSHTLNKLQWVYLGIAAFGCLINILFAVAKLPEVRQEVNESLEAKVQGSFWKQHHLLAGAFTEFLYVGAQVGVASLAINFFVEQPGDQITVGEAANLYAVCQAIFTFGRFVGVPILYFFDSALVLAVFGLGAVIFSILTAEIPAKGGIACLMIVFFFESVCYPIIFTLSTSNLGSYQKLGAALVAAGVSGGAWYPSVQASIADKTSTRNSYLFAVLGFAAVSLYGVYMNVDASLKLGHWVWKKPARAEVIEIGVAGIAQEVDSESNSEKVNVKGDSVTELATVPYSKKH